MMTIYVNNRKVVCNSGNVSIHDGVVIVDGKQRDYPKDINQKITITGNCGNIDIVGNLTIEGDVNGDIDVTGNVTCANVGGDIDATGNVVIKNEK